jgi:hypothetical protein
MRITFSEKRAVYEIIWKKVGRAGEATNVNTIQCMHFACWITKTTDTQLESEIVIAFPRKECFRYTHTACLVLTRKRTITKAVTISPRQGVKCVLCDYRRTCLVKIYVVTTSHHIIILLKIHFFSLSYVDSAHF